MLYKRSQALDATRSGSCTQRYRPKVSSKESAYTVLTHRVTSAPICFPINVRLSRQVGKRTPNTTSTRWISRYFSLVRYCSTDEEHAHEAILRHRFLHHQQLALPGLAGSGEQNHRVHTRGGAGVLAEHVEASEIDEHVSK